MRQPCNISCARGKIWKVTYLKNCKLVVRYFFSSGDPRPKTLEEILKLRSVDSKNLSFRDVLRMLGEQTIPRTKRLAKKLFKEVMDEAVSDEGVPEEHF